MWQLISLIMIILACITGEAYARPQVKNVEEVKTSFKAADVALSRSGRYAYVLSQEGELHIYKSGWAEIAKMPLGKGIIGIRTSDRDDELFTIDREGKLKIVRLVFPKDIDTSNSPFKGNEKAKLEIVVFSDFECPHCASLAKVLDRVVEKFKDQVKMVFKHCPLGYHKLAVEAAQASVAAMRQKKFWEFHDLLFDHQKELSPQKLQELAAALGLDMERFNKDKASPEVVSIISRDVNQAKALEIKGVPAVYINGEHQENTEEEALTKEIQTRLGNRPGF